MKKVLVTGASGFVGSYFLKKYQQKYNFESFSFLNDDFSNLDLCSVDVIVHLSALVHQMGGASYTEYFRINVIQTLDLAKKAKLNGVKQFIFMSSVKVYGEESDVPYTELTPCRPQDDYGKSKLEAENQLKKLEDKNFKVVIIRTPIVYGYGVKANIRSLINLVQRVSFLPFGKINNRRSMIYVGNLCFVVDHIIQEKRYGLFLVADKKTLSTTQMIEYIAMVLDKKVYLFKVPFFASLLHLLKPSFYKRLFESLEIESSFEKELPYETLDGIRYMIKGEK